MRLWEEADDAVDLSRQDVEVWKPVADCPAEGGHRGTGDRGQGLQRDQRGARRVAYCSGRILLPHASGSEEVV